MVENLGLSAEHGSFVKAPQDDEFSNMTETLDMSWMSEVEEIFRFYMEVSSVSRHMETSLIASELAAVRSRSRRPVSLGTTETRILTLGA